MNLKVNVVLVRSTYSSNVGQSARALANIGGGRLILINSQCEIDESARQGAAGAQDQLMSMTTYSSWTQFYKKEGSGYRIALTRRSGRKRHVSDLDETLRQLSADQMGTAAASDNLYLVFGPEAAGLSSEDMGFCHQSCALPVFGEFQSMNLAQAVLLALFITRQIFPLPSNKREAKKDSAKSKTPKPMYFPDESIKQWLVAMGFDIRKRKASAYLTLKRLLLQNWPTDGELQVLEAILQQNIRKLRLAETQETGKRRQSSTSFS